MTECSFGIGLAIVQFLLRQGREVVGLSRSRPALDHSSFTHLDADLLDAAEMEQALADAPVLGALVHAAGLLRIGTHETIMRADGEKMWRLHVDSAARLVQQLTPAMPRNDRIVLIGSRVAGGARAAGSTRRARRRWWGWPARSPRNSRRAATR